MIEELYKKISATKPPEEIEKKPFGAAMWPWVELAQKKLKKKAGKTFDLLSPKAQDSLGRSLFASLSKQALPSLALEMSIAKLEERLEGETSQKRYQHFVKSTLLRPEKLSAFFGEYKVLKEMLDSILTYWVEQVAELLERLENDWSLLEKSFNGGAPLGKIADFHQNLGDAHQKGRSVVLLDFECGKSFLYKPKNLSGAKIFFDLLEDFNRQGLSPPLKGYTVVDRGEYGWEEKVLHKECTHPAEVEKYYVRGGMLLCLLYLFYGTDAHLENIFACGEHPILIDLETLFHQSFAEKDLSLRPDEVLRYSVMSTGLLPFFQETQLGKKGNDISGFGGEEREEIEYHQCPTWKEINTDEMHLVYETRKEKNDNTHLVRCNGKVAPATEYVDALADGFKRMYDFIYARRSALLQQGGWISRFSEAPFRFVMRATRFYAYLLNRLSAPEVILDKGSLDRELNHLSRYLLEKGKEHLAPLVASEKEALLRGDIPFFYSYPKSGALYADGKVALSDCLENSYDKVCKKIEGMSTEERDLQITFVRQVFQAKGMNIHGKGKLQISKQIVSGASVEDASLLKAALSIAEDLEKRAFRSPKGGLDWISLEPDPVLEQWLFGAISSTLYSGKMGIALYFASLFHITKEERWKKLSIEALKGLRTLIEEKSDRLIAIVKMGGMEGAGGIIWGIATIGSLLADSDLIQEAQKVAYLLQEEHISADKVFDFIGGAAGLLLALIKLWKLTKDPHALHLATLCGEHLCTHALPMEKGVAWKGITDQPLLGFSHGVAGIAYALLHLAKATKNEKFTKLAKSSLEYERAHFCPKEKNWPRFSEEGNSFQSSWCHGAAGVGLSRIALLDVWQDETIREEARTAVTTTQNVLKDLKTNNLGLCCGLFGQLELLIAADPHFPELNLKKQIHELLATALPHLDGKQAKEVTQELYTPSFMQGASGIGYTLLRFYDKQRQLPQALLMD